MAKMQTRHHFVYSSAYNDAMCRWRRCAILVVAYASSDTTPLHALLYTRPAPSLQTLHRVLNTSPLQYSCSSSCVTGLLHSACNQCGGGGSGCAALRLDAGVADAACVVDAAV
jgi:hypothetical protein